MSSSIVGIREDRYRWFSSYNFICKNSNSAHKMWLYQFGWTELRVKEGSIVGWAKPGHEYCMHEWRVTVAGPNATVPCRQARQAPAFGMASTVSVFDVNPPTSSTSLATLVYLCTRHFQFAPNFTLTVSRRHFTPLGTWREWRSRSLGISFSIE